MSTDVQARLDFQGGADSYHRDDGWHAGIIRHYETNLRRMRALSRNANVPLFFLLPPSNLADSPPFKSEPNSNAAEVSQFVQSARESYKTDLNKAVENLERARKLDPRHAAVLFELARAYESAGRLEEAHATFIQARDEDVCPLRMVSELEQAMHQVATDEGVPLLDLHATLEAQARSGILGSGLLVDHIHPSFKGNQVIANAIVELMTDEGLLAPESGWKQRSAEAHASHFKSLDNLYFLRGQRTLETLNDWARGREFNLPPRPKQ